MTSSAQATATSPVFSAGTPNTVRADHPAGRNLVTVPDQAQLAMAMASHPSTSVARMFELSTDPRVQVRLRVAANPNTPGEILIRLSADIDPAVRVAVASNIATPTSALCAATIERSGPVFDAAAVNPSTPADIRTIIGWGDRFRR